EESPDLPRVLGDMGRFVADHVDLEALRAAAAAGGCGGQSKAPQPALASASASVAAPGGRIALARDAAFSFVYPHLLADWRGAGAEILPFSPLADEAPDPSADCCWLPGGYPELHAGRLAAAANFRRGLRDFAQTRPVHGECGGYMAMGAGLIDKDGVRHEMAGLLGLVTSYAARKMHLGYRVATLRTAMPGHGTGARLRGHEFHYSTIVTQPDAPLADVIDATGALVAQTGSWRGFDRGGRATGSYFHLIGRAT
ncbi:MAG: cobyrinic acid a,c-diamide synthase, partial [Paracoccaceae bacterium]|nr:cobyrinic acid a,c-diamide synthase [Paracoccaceae bacterium]